MSSELTDDVKTDEQSVPVHIQLKMLFQNQMKILAGNKSIEVPFVTPDTQWEKVGCPQMNVRCLKGRTSFFDGYNLYAKERDTWNRDFKKELKPSPNYDIIETKADDKTFTTNLVFTSSNKKF